MLNNQLSQGEAFALARSEPEIIAFKNARDSTANRRENSVFRTEHTSSYNPTFSKPPAGSSKGKKKRGGQLAIRDEHERHCPTLIVRGNTSTIAVQLKKLGWGSIPACSGGRHRVKLERPEEKSTFRCETRFGQECHCHEKPAKKSCFKSLLTRISCPNRFLHPLDQVLAFRRPLKSASESPLPAGCRPVRSVSELFPRTSAA